MSSAGTFKMGNDNGPDNEKPAHDVTLSDYRIGKFKITQGLWKVVMGNDPSNIQYSDNYPVGCVSWNCIVNDFLPKLNQMMGKNYTLHTEAQWEFATRGGTKSKGYTYSGSNNISEVA